MGSVTHVLSANQVSEMIASAHFIGLPIPPAWAKFEVCNAHSCNEKVAMEDEGV
jgi:hypothetical protein